MKRNRVRVAIDTSKLDEFVDVRSNTSPSAWRGAALNIEFAIFDGDVLDNVADYSSILVEVRDYDERTSQLLMSKAIAAADMNTALSLTEWNAGDAQHGVIKFLGQETNLDLLGRNQRDFWLVFSAVVDEDAEPITLGGTRFIMKEDGSLVDARAIPPLGASLIPIGTNYSGLGEYILPVISGRNHLWTKGANDLTLVNGTETLNASGSFIAQGATVTLTGTPSALITATVRYPVYLTADEADARYLRNVAKVIKPRGVIEQYTSENGLYRRLEGIDNNGLPISVCEPIP
jgi:hypothetical protein